MLCIAYGKQPYRPGTIKLTHYWVKIMDSGGDQIFNLIPYLHLGMLYYLVMKVEAIPFLVNYAICVSHVIHVRAQYLTTWLVNGIECRWLIFTCIGILLYIKPGHTLVLSSKALYYFHIALLHSPIITLWSVNSVVWLWNGVCIHQIGGSLLIYI